jgi:hypothetical protein
MLFYSEKLKKGNASKTEKKIKFLTTSYDCFYIDTPLEKHPKISMNQIAVIGELISLIKQHLTENDLLLDK